MPAAAPSFEEIADTFELLDDWEERYRYVIELGKDLPGLDDGARTPERKVDGCASQVWLAPDIRDGKLYFDGDSDAHIVRGLIAVLRALLSGRPTAEVASLDVTAKLGEIGLADALSSQRSNGLRAMTARLQSIAAAVEAGR